MTTETKLKDKFLQLHLVFSYGPAILNRDDQGRHKTALVGGIERLRYSSQCAKRAWRTSDLFHDAVEGHVGTRTRYIYKGIIEHLISEAGGEHDEKTARGVAFNIAALWKKAQAKGETEADGDPTADAAVEDKSANKKAAKKKAGADPTQVLFLFSDAEWRKALAVAEELARGQRKDVQLSDFLSGNDTTAVDVALWGRMLAENKDYSVTASCSVSHAITTHKGIVEDDYFSACDDRPDLAGDAGPGASHIDSKSFGAGVFYHYICVDREQLLAHLGDNLTLANLAIAGLIKTATQVTPTAGQSTHAHGTRAAYILAEIGDQQPRSLAAAFTKPIRGGDALTSTVEALTSWRQKLDALDGQCWSKVAVRDATGSEARGSLDDLIALGRIS
jgi:CRISPR system Cascade subunit CasC